MIAGHRNVLHRIGDRRRPRGRHQRRRAALQRGQPLFQHVGGGSVDGHCSCVGGGVGVFLTNVEL